MRVHPENLDRQKLPKAARKGDVWKRRYREINDWERYLTENGLRIVKLFLNISKEEQRARLLRRIDLPDHNWKFSAADVNERERWDDYQRAFSEMLSHTSTEWAPWYVIPADRKWFARFTRSGGAGSHADGDRPSLSACHQATARGAAGGQAATAGASTQGRPGRPVRAEAPGLLRIRTRGQPGRGRPRAWDRSVRDRASRVGRSAT